MSTVQSIERAFAVLRSLTTGPAGVTDIAERVDLPKSTVSRLLSTLETLGAVEQLEAASHAFSKVLYERGGAAGGPAGAAGPAPEAASGGKGDDDVIEGEFEVKK